MGTVDPAGTWGGNLRGEGVDYVTGLEEEAYGVSGRFFGGEGRGSEDCKRW
jgi:hypothetical protein